ncbi:MAG: hypothetical protein HY225_00290 [Candidatus Vogelbacteria bacterium]|nr:hypothetical protein [Candidatus Vogelbacteria bacterium]
MEKTIFALASIDIKKLDGGIITIWFDGNGKVTRSNGNFTRPVANSFSLVQVVDCPFATATCKSICYVHKLEKKEQEVHDRYVLNSGVFKIVLADEILTALVVDAFAKYINENCLGGFRWHVSGDITSTKHAEFIRRVCEKTPDVAHWIYTRSFEYIEPLLDVQNLVLNLSVDKDNWSEAVVYHYAYNLRMCYLTVDGEVPDDLPEGSVLFPNHELRGRDLEHPRTADWWQKITKKQRQMVCPADFFGQSERIRCGPCKKCLK